MLKTLHAFLILMVAGSLLVACKKDSIKPDPVKEANNSRIEVTPQVLQSVSVSTNSSSGGFYVALPSLYDSTSKSYPLLVSLHGAGQYGNGTTELYAVANSGLPKLFNLRTFPPSFTVNGQNFSFILIAPQFTRYPANEEIEAVINYAQKHYRVDSKRIYVTGLSMGGEVTWNVGAAYPTQIAAIVPIAAAPKDDNHAKAKSIADNKLPVWALQNDKDDVSNAIFTIDFIASINSFSPALPPKFTLINAEGHDAWTEAYNPNHRENGLNVYEWMLQYSK